MSVSEEVLQSTFDDVPEDMELPPGEYIFEVLNYNLDTTNSEEPKPFFEPRLRAIQVVNTEAAITDDDLVNAYPVRERLYLTPKAMKMTKRFFDAIGLETEGVPLGTLFEMSIGQHVKARTEVEERNGYRNVKVVRWMPL